MSPTQTSTVQKTVLSVPTGDVIYDALMSKIEMDLITVNLPRLAEKYKGESAEDRAQRFKRYEKAYALYDEAFAIWIGTFHAEVEQYRRTVLKMAEEKDREGETNAFEELEQALSTSDNKK